jgi:hypothetical protein
MKNTQRRYIKWAILNLLLFVLAGCATGPRYIEHAFSFDAASESPDMEVLDYRYGNSKQPGTHAPEWALKTGHIGQQTSINGGMPRGDSLYVKWRIRKTGQEYEDTVDLKSRLPADITNHRIHFIVQGAQLHVYLVSPEKLNPNPCPPRAVTRKLGQSDNPDDRIFSMYCYRKITKLYPN